MYILTYSRGGGVIRNFFRNPGKMLFLGDILPYKNLPQGGVIFYFSPAWDLGKMRICLIQACIRASCLAGLHCVRGVGL